MYASDSLETILTYLSTKVVTVIADVGWLPHLYYLLEFLAAWEERPACLTPMAYQWCSAISEVAGRVGPNETPREPPFPMLQLQLRFRPRDLAVVKFAGDLPAIAEREFSEVGPGCDLFRLDDTPHPARRRARDLTPDLYSCILVIILEIGFRLAVPGRTWSALHLGHAPHCSLIFKTAFSSCDDEVLADAMHVWIADCDRTPPGSCIKYLAERVEKDSTPFSPRLRRLCICVIERTWRGELEVLGLDTVHLLNRLDVGVDDMVEKRGWALLLVKAIRLPTGLERLSSHYWRPLDKLALAANDYTDHTLDDVALTSCDVDVMMSLEEAEDWEKLEVWMVIMWLSLSRPAHAMTEQIAIDIEHSTLKLLLQRPSVLLRFEDLSSLVGEDAVLRRICDQAQVGRLAPEPPLPP